MKKFDVGQTINSLANIGVIAGIVFLAIQIQQNTDAQRLTAVQQVLGLSYSNTMMVASSESLGEVFGTLRTGDELTPKQEAQLSSFLRGRIRALWQAYILYENRVLDDDIFFNYEFGANELVDDPTGHDWWERNRDGYPKSFQEWIDSFVDAE